MMEKITTFKFDPVKTPGLTHADNLTVESAQAVKEVLEDNNTKYHIFQTTEDQMGIYLHNHIAHHDITLWAIGATPELIRYHHGRNVLVQRGAFSIQESLVVDMSDPKIFKRCLGKEENFKNFEKFFMGEITKLGYEEVLQKYMFNGSEVADDILWRMYQGYVHSLIHINFAIEFKQPLLLAESFAQACVHDDQWYTKYLTASEALAATSTESPLPLSACYDLQFADPAISNSSSYYYHSQRRPSGIWAGDVEQARDGVLVTAFPEICRIAARYRVDPNDLERATAELINSAVLSCAGAQRPPKECKFDFYLLHSVTASIGHTAFLQEKSLSNAQKARFLEHTGRVFMLTYAGMGCPELLSNLDWLVSHPPKRPNQGWAEIFQRATLHQDDGHFAKMIRCTAHAHKVSAPYDHLPEFRLKQHMFLPIGNAMIDSGMESAPEGTKQFDWTVRGAGFPEAWNKVPLRSVRVPIQDSA